MDFMCSCHRAFIHETIYYVGLDKLLASKTFQKQGFSGSLIKALFLKHINFTKNI